MILKHIVIGTHNEFKTKEIQNLLPQYKCLSLKNFNINSVPNEIGATFIENALIKARHFSNLCNEACLSDDSGICIPALGGAPGIYSARFSKENASDQENCHYLLKKMSSIKDRTAYFHCTIVILRHPYDPDPILAQGTWCGEIAHQHEGVHGFGYDSIFWIPEHQKTAAQLTMEEKNKYSHRAQALNKIISILHSENHLL